MSDFCTNWPDIFCPYPFLLYSLTWHKNDVHRIIRGKSYLSCKYFQYQSCLVNLRWAVHSCQQTLGWWIIKGVWRPRIARQGMPTLRTNKFLAKVVRRIVIYWCVQFVESSCTTSTKAYCVMIKSSVYVEFSWSSSARYLYGLLSACPFVILMTFPDTFLRFLLSNFPLKLYQKWSKFFVLSEREGSVRGIPRDLSFSRALSDSRKWNVV